MGRDEVDEDRTDWGEHGYVPPQRTPAESLPPDRRTRVRSSDRGPEISTEPDPLEGTRDPRTGRIIVGLDGKIRVWLNDDPDNPIRQYPIDAFETMRLGRGTIEKPVPPPPKINQPVAPKSRRVG